MKKMFKGLEIPAIGFGTHRISDKSVIKEALKAGYRHIDTARSYSNEKEVGDVIKSSGIPRQELFVTTKIWHDRLKPEEVYQDIDDSLRKLQSDYVDLLLIHWPSSENVPLAKTLEAFEKVKEAGKAKAIGVSNFTPQLLKEAESIAEIHCNQVEYHPFLGQKELVNYCAENALALTAYRPIAESTMSGEQVLKELASKYNKSSAQITLRWLLQQEPVVAIPRSGNPEHIKANIDVFDFELSSEEMSAIHKLNRGERKIDPAFAPNW